MAAKKFEYEGIKLGGPRHVYRQNLILRFLEGSGMKGRALDAGCGDGCVSLGLAKKGWEVHALDYSLDFLNILKQRLADHNLSKNVKIYHKNLEPLDFPDSFFQAVVCGEVLEHMEDDSRIITSFNRVLQPGGVCVVTVPLLSKGWDKSDDFFGHQRLYSLDSFREMVESRGFELEKYLCWGFPLMRVYYNLIYLNWFKRMKNYSHGQRDITARIGKSGIISYIGAQIFRFDEIFGRLQWGVGLAARLRKVSD
ncbi:class I SAM-dependent methyltransferase [Candidatus Omnitrophota bacterium]